MDGIITYNERRDLQKRVKLLCENDGIENQIIHLGSPDDNECFDSVFFYLETEINKVISEWIRIKRQILYYKKERT